MHKILQKYNDISDIIAEVFEYDDNDLWLEMELANKLTNKLFLDIVGISFKHFVTGLKYYYFNEIKPSRYLRYDKPEYMDELWENEFTSSILNFISNYNILIGDLEKLSTYGIVKRNGQDNIVMIDYGLDNEVYSKYYKR